MAGNDLAGFRNANANGKGFEWIGALGERERGVFIREYPKDVAASNQLPLQLRLAATKLRQDSGALSSEEEPLVAASDSIVHVDDSRSGQVVEVCGNLEGAEIIVTVVPGMGSSLSNFDRGTKSKVENVRRTIVRIDPDRALESVAGIAWLGYFAPQDATVLSSRSALTGGRALCDLSEVLRRDFPNAELVFVGNSYGSVVVGAGCQMGLQADRVVATGSPGMLTATCAGLGLHPSVAVAACANLTDPVARSGWFGQPPHSRRFGATRLRGNPLTGPFQAHTTYFDFGSAALDHVSASIVDVLDESMVYG